ncbi:MAG: 50S ribosomal protein L13, partial [Bacteroidota bacterium]
MDTLSYKTVSANAKTVTKEWVVLDAKDQVLGRFASQAAMMLRGKHKANFTPHVDCGDNVIIINADKIRLTGRKWTEREYVSHTGYPGGQRFVTPAKLIQHALLEGSGQDNDKGLPWSGGSGRPVRLVMEDTALVGIL